MCSVCPSMLLSATGSMEQTNDEMCKFAHRNAYVRTDPAGNIKLDKEKSTEKVDGAVALVMALDRAMKNMNGGSVYDYRDMLTLDW